MSIFRRQSPAAGVAVADPPVRVQPTEGEIHAQQVREWERINALPQWDHSRACPACGCTEVSPRVLTITWQYPPDGDWRARWDLSLVQLAVTCALCGNGWHCKPLNHAEQWPEGPQA